MNWLASDGAMVRKLILKDWQVYQKQLAGFLGGMLLALGLVGMGTPLLASAACRPGSRRVASGRPASP